MHYFKIQTVFAFKCTIHSLSHSIIIIVTHIPVVGQSSFGAPGRTLPLFLPASCPRLFCSSAPRGGAGLGTSQGTGSTGSAGGALSV